MHTEFISLADFKAQAAQLATDALRPLYFESDGAGEFVVTPENVWGYFLEMADWGGPVLAKADLAEGRAYFLPIAEAALKADPQPAVPYSVEDAFSCLPEALDYQRY